MTIKQGEELKPKELRMWLDEKGFHWVFGKGLTVVDMYIMGGIVQDEGMRTIRGGGKDAVHKGQGDAGQDTG